MAGWSPTAARAADACPNANYRVGPSANLPDCRAYEQVSPADKDNYTLVQNHGGGSTVYASTTGDQAYFAAITPFADPKTGRPGAYVSRRGAAGWASVNVQPRFCGPDPSGLLGGTYPTGFAQDFSTTILSADANDNCASGDHAGKDVYTVAPDGTLTWVSQNGQPKTVDAGATLIGNSADASHIVFTTSEKLVLPLEDARQPGKGLYDRTGGRTLAVAVDDDGTLINDCAPAPAGGDDYDLAPSVSADGRVIFFRSGSSTTVPGCSPTTDDGGQLYARIDHRHTVMISPSLLTIPEPRQIPRFMGATADGHKAFFTSTERLTEGATTSGGLYEYDLTAVLAGTATTGTLTFLTPSIDGNPANLTSLTRGLVGLSDDGSRAYFIADGRLDPAAPSGTNLYVTQGGDVTYVAPWIGSQFVPSKDAAVSPDGSKVVFPGRPSGSSTTQLYLAAPGTGVAPVCVSCAAGVTPAGSPDLVGTSARPSRIGPLRNVTDDGRVFFDSPDQLSPRDTNTVYDVYEYHAGEQVLLSAGTGDQDSLLIGPAGPDARDVFFVTSDSLVGSDFDNGDQDLYDARVGGGFPAPAAAGLGCSGDACQAPPTLTPTAPAAATVDFHGAGNVSARGTVSSTRAQIVVARAGRGVRGVGGHLRVHVGTGGRVVANGPRVRRVSKRVRRAGTVRLTVRLTRSMARRVRHGHRVRLRVRVRLAPAKGRARSVRVRMVFRPMRHRAAAHRSQAAGARAAHRASAAAATAGAKGGR